MSEIRELELEEFKQQVADGAAILDTRVPDIFERGFIAKSLNVGLNGPFEKWAAELLEKDQKLVIVADNIEESLKRLQDIGFNNISGYLKGGFNAWKEDGKRFDMVISIDTEEFELDLNFREETVIDVRSRDEYNTQRITEAINIPLEELSTYEGLDKEKYYYLHCGGGYRSITAASILKQRGFNLLKNIYGGFNKIKETRIPLTPPKPSES
ncbi:MAG: hypothetical protein H7321_01005 [Bacteroidia bacterium]|nr:hypothetical protein [Bacteroidia bacterium]